MTSSGIFTVSSSFGVRASIKAEVLRSSCPLVLEGIFDWSADMLQLSPCRFSGILCRFSGIFIREDRLLTLCISISPLGHISGLDITGCLYSGIPLLVYRIVSSNTVKLSHHNPVYSLIRYLISLIRYLISLIRYLMPVFRYLWLETTMSGLPV